MTVITILTAAGFERKFFEKLVGSLGHEMMGLENISKVIFVRLFCGESSGKGDVQNFHLINVYLSFHLKPFFLRFKKVIWKDVSFRQSIGFYTILQMPEAFSIAAGDCSTKM